MNKVNKYNEYCVLISRLDSKTIELNQISTQRNRLIYEVESLKKDLDEYKEISDMNPEEIYSIKKLRMRSCFNTPLYFEEGGSVTESPIIDFKKSREYKDFTAADKKLFKMVESDISETQYNLQNAILIGQTDDDEFDVYESSIIEDYIDEIMIGLSNYEEQSIENLKKIKQIMYKFVERVSKM